MSDAFFLILVQMSIVKMVEEELKMDVNELIRAANITASMRPVKPNFIHITTVGKCWTWFTLYTVPGGISLMTSSA